ncbi:hypothetical protein P3L10_023869 [Capsicum annuum]
MPLPEQILCPMRIFKFGVSVLNEMLCVHSTSVSESEGAYKFWVMKEYGVKESWNVLFTIYDPRVCEMQPIYWFADGKLLYFFRDVVRLYLGRPVGRLYHFLTATILGVLLLQKA